MQDIFVTLKAIFNNISTLKKNELDVPIYVISVIIVSVIRCKKWSPEKTVVFWKHYQVLHRSENRQVKN